MQLWKILKAVEMVFDRPIELLIRHFENRLFELAMASVFLVESVFLLFSPGSIEAGGMKYLAQIMSLPTVILLFFLIGASRIVALALNGSWVPYGSYVRACGAALGVVMWLQVAAALVVFASVGNALPFSTPVYVVLAIFEGISMFRALAGAKRNGRCRPDRKDVDVGDQSHRILASYLASKPSGNSDRATYHSAPMAGRLS